MINIAILDDSQNDIQNLKKLLSNFAKTSKEQFSVDCYNRGLTFLDNLKKKYDIVFFDIDMPVMNGLEVAKKLRQQDDKVIIIFTTNLASMAINGYEVTALDFLVKPIVEEQLSIVLTRALKYINKGDARRLMIRVKGGFKAISYNEIVYIEVKKHDLNFHSVTGEIFTTRGTLKDVESLLDPNVFAKCNSCYLVNLNHVKSIIDDEVITGVGKLEISRAKKKAFVEAFMNNIR